MAECCVTSWRAAHHSQTVERLLRWPNELSHPPPRDPITATVIQGPMEGNKLETIT